MSEKRRRVLVVGGGASGMAAAYFAAQQGAMVTLLEKNEKLGKKIYITGKGRCNVTNSADVPTFLEHVVSHPHFLRSAAARFAAPELMELLESLGTPLKVERGHRVFPVSDHASDITRAWERGLHAVGVEVRLHTKVDALQFAENKVQGVVLSDGEVLRAEAVIVATGGLSYPSTGSTGDGYALAKTVGHTISTLRPSLLPLVLREAYPALLEGLSLRHVTLTIRHGKKKWIFPSGELVFTADGISGPLALTASAHIGEALEMGACSAHLDLKPALSEKELDARLLREFTEAPNRTLKTVLHTMLPSRLCPVFLQLCALDAQKVVHDCTRTDRRMLRQMMKQMPMTVVGTHGYDEAVITQGGISVKEIEPRTMASRRCKGLFFAGEVLDLDATTGGFNLQIAWTTGYAAGCGAAGEGADDGISNCD